MLEKWENFKHISVIPFTLGISCPFSMSLETLELREGLEAL